MLQVLESACMQRDDSHGFWGLLISSWQYVSQFLWQHSHAQDVNAFVVAVVSTAICAAAFGTPALRYANAPLGLWLLSSSWALPRRADATMWNNVLVSVAMLVLLALPHLLRRRSA